MAPQSGIFPIFLRAEYRGDGEGFSRFQSDAARAAAQAKREFQGVAAALDDALARPRNSVGSLDLGLDELRQAAVAQQQIAAAAREVAEATNRARAAATGYDAQLSKSTQAAFKLAAAEDAKGKEMLEQIRLLEQVQSELNRTASATDQLIQSQRRGTTARGNVINSVRSERVAFIQLGQQLQDVSIQAQMGTDAFLIFGQQVPQAAFALSGLSDSSNSTLSSIGEFATFLSGPWGAALFAATAFLGPLVFEMLGFSEEAEKATSKAFSFTSSLDIMKLSAADATAAMDELADSLRTAITLQGDFTNAKIADARRDLDILRAAIAEDEKLVADRERARKAEFLPGLAGFLPNSANNPAAVFETSQIKARLQENRDKLPAALQRAAIADIAETNRAVEAAADPILAKIREVEAAIGVLNQRRERTLTNTDPLAEIDGIGREDFNRQLGELSRQKEALEKQRREANREPRTRRARVNREPEQPDRFAEQTAERVARINDRFSEQTRLVTQSIQANRELDNIIRDTNEKMAKAKSLTADQRKEFEGIIKAAEETRKTIDAALIEPFENLKRESEERLQVEQLLAQGRTDEAAALQAVLQLQRQIGTETQLRAALEQAIAAKNQTEIDRVRGLLSGYQRRMETVRETVIAEQQLTRELRDQQAIFQAQLGVVQTVRRDLTDLLSGRSTDFFGNFRQALQDLQGQKLFESIFGQTFRDIENELQSQTPLGKANKAFADNVDLAAKTTNRVERLFNSLGDATELLVERMLVDPGEVQSIINDQITKRNYGFDPGAGPANDNNIGEIIVAASKTDTRLARSSTIDLAERISKGIGESIGAELEDVFGPRFATLFGDIVGGVIEGKVRGGTPGAIFGGLEKLTGGIKGFEGISSLFGRAGEGAAVGTQVAGISKLLGLKGSNAGAQIGGAIGSFIPIPGGNIIGAVAGSLLGGLLKSTPRASATIGSVGGSLGLTSVTGTKANLRDAAGNLGESVLEAVNRIAEQLGASVNASAGKVSIGQRKDSLRVDTTGRGITKIGNGAVDFGDDVEAAIAFAVRDLIQDGVITGLKASEQRLLKAGKDIEAALQDVLTFRSVSDRLQQIKDPVGFAIGQLNREFEGLIGLFERASASSQEFADLEELYGLERARVLEEAAERVSSSLQQLLNDLKIGDNGLSLRDRRANALTEFNGLATRVAAGDSSAFDDFADISQQLLDIERQLFGSTQAYFDRLNQITALTETAIAGQTNVTPIGNNLPSPFDERNNVARTIEATGAEQVSWLRALNDNVIALPAALRDALAGGGGFGGVSSFRGAILPSQIQNF